MEEWISLRAYARHREVTLSAVQKAIEAGRVTAVQRNAQGRLTAIEKHAADRQWAANTDPVEAARNGKLPGVAPGPAVAAGMEETSTGPPVAPAAPTTVATGDQAEYLAARAKREGFLARQAELDMHERAQSLAPWGAVEDEFSEIFSQLKSSVFRIADRKAQILAAETDPIRVHSLLNEEFRTVFDECSRRFADNAARVVGDAGVAVERETALP